ncbi:MAG: hypothetical protein ABIQ92_09585 [Ornithinibacter sp.]
MRHLRASEVKIGQRVLHAGARDDQDVFDPALLRQGHVLEHHHPGVVACFYGPGVNHCVVRFIGLELEPISTAIGFDHDQNGCFAGLLFVTDDEWERALSAGWWATSH